MVVCRLTLSCHSCMRSAAMSRLFARFTQPFLKNWCLDVSLVFGDTPFAAVACHQTTLPIKRRSSIQLRICTFFKDFPLLMYLFFDSDEKISRRSHLWAIFPLKFQKYSQSTIFGNYWNFFRMLKIAACSLIAFISSVMRLFFSGLARSLHLPPIGYLLFLH